ncbi:thioredoxin [Deinococcus pimensis]|uniref:thioredoxin n=1 Tax=Deinococcus pimensis TaxID=309888 RepID=UPI000484CEF6|nr:thioredoxin [Deinococcus pimensis]
MSQIVELSDSNFAAETASGYTLVDFTAEWCGPCRTVAPIVTQLASELEGRARVAKLDVDRNPSVAMKYRVMGMPTFILFHDGRPVATLVGAHPKRAFDAFVKQHVALA